MHSKKFNVRRYDASDADATYQLFYDTVHQINSKDYTQKQIDAWAPKTSNIEEWNKSLCANFSFVATEAGTKKIIGFF